jgi:diguanylate cyclase (GGDEF)-like protein
MKPRRPALILALISGFVALVGFAAQYWATSVGGARPLTEKLPLLWAMVVFGLSASAETKKVTIAYGNQRYAMSWSEGPQVIGVLLLSPVTNLSVQLAAVAAGMVGRGVLVGSRPALAKLTVNLSLAALKTGVTSVPVLLLAGEADPLTLGALLIAAVLGAEAASISAMSLVFHLMGRPFERREWARGHVVGLIVSVVVASSTFAAIEVAVFQPGLLPFMLVLPLVAFWAIPTIARLLEDRNTWSRHGTFISTLDNSSLEEALRQLCTQLAVERIDMVAHVNRYSTELQRAWVTANGSFHEEIVESDPLWGDFCDAELNHVTSFSRGGTTVPQYLGGARDALVVTVGATDGISVWAATGYSSRTSRLRQRSTFPHSMHEVFASWTWNIHNALDARRRLAEVQQRAWRDSVTGLANRDKFRSVLELELQLAAENARGPMTVAMIDIDSFKAMNDTWGHHIGDSYLVHVARALQGAAPSDATVARLSGDEFAVLLPEVGPEAAQATVQRFIPALTTTFRPTGNSAYNGSGSVGYACYPTDLNAALEPSEATSQLMRHADAAMYSAKRSKSLVPLRFDSSRDERSEEHDRISVEITEALATDRLVVWFQPIFETRSLMGSRRKVAMLEALARITTPNGMLMPGEFVPIAEQTKQIHAITERVLDLACEQLGRWRHFDVGVAVNLSAANLLDANLPTAIGDRIKRWNIDPSRLVVEVTETMMMTEELNSQATLEQVRALGVKVSIDDFGVGHSSLSRLLTLPIDELKVDREFLVAATRPRVDEDTTSNRATMVLQTMVELAQRLGIGSTVEGVETMEALKLVADLGADHVQGYVASRPISAADATTLLELTNPEHDPGSPQKAAAGSITGFNRATGPVRI